MNLIYVILITQSIALIALSVVVGMDMAQAKSDIKFLYNHAIISQNNTINILKILQANQVLDEHQLNRIEKLEGSE